MSSDHRRCISESWKNACDMLLAAISALSYAKLFSRLLLLLVCLTVLKRLLNYLTLFRLQYIQHVTFTISSARPVSFVFEFLLEA
jgi:hypothetical protein